MGQEVANVFYVILLFYKTLTIGHLLLLWQHSVQVEQSVNCSGDLRMMLGSPEHQQNSPLCKLTLQSRQGSSICTQERMHISAAVSALSHTCDFFSHTATDIREHYKLTDSWGKPDSTFLHAILQDALQFWGPFLRKGHHHHTQWENM